MTPIPVVIIARGNLGLTKLAVKSVLAQDVPVTLVVIDNASSDGTSDWLKTKPFTCPVYFKQHSLSTCWNSALKYLWAQGFNRALILNNDVQIRPDTARLLDAHGGEFVTCVSVDDIDRIGVPGDREIEDLRKGEREHPDYSAYLIRKSVTDKGCWFNEECFPAYVEDSFHHVAMHRAGIKAVCIDLPFYHYAAGTLKTADEGEKARIRRGADANRELFRKAYGCLPGSPEYEKLFL